ncbi:hypothetical protein PsorP6_015145 [Peronosclerospora sorghi]|uniref:Uncharacterized protein n=1 Tax=Peronosclerospora sorghi TaxID=230839 RepID=A0ACC0VVX1_9STRA|nr:hypothetical protein PsorP6_015145 [Peronosclerospora sorghi]
MTREHMAKNYFRLKSSNFLNVAWALTKREKFKRSNLIIRAYTTFSVHPKVVQRKMIVLAVRGSDHDPDNILTGAAVLSGNDVQDLEPHEQNTTKYWKYLPFYPLILMKALTFLLVAVTAFGVSNLLISQEPSAENASDEQTWKTFVQYGHEYQKPYRNDADNSEVPTHSH